MPRNVIRIRRTSSADSLFRNPWHGSYEIYRKKFQAENYSKTLAFFERRWDMDRISFISFRADLFQVYFLSFRCETKKFWRENFSFSFIHAARKTLSTVKPSMIAEWMHNSTQHEPLFPSEQVCYFFGLKLKQIAINRSKLRFQANSGLYCGFRSENFVQIWVFFCSFVLRFLKGTVVFVCKNNFL